MIRLFLVSSIVLSLTKPLVAEIPGPILALNGNDPIALVDGKEVAGSDKHELTHGLFRYRFCSESNKKLFQQKPDEYAIQFGGACGKMGPFSGNGSPGRYYVHQRRIYIFASESCRNSFKLEPEKHIELPNPTPEGTAAEKKRGIELVDLAIDGFGGTVKVDSLRNLQIKSTWVYKQGKTETLSQHNECWSVPDRMRVEDIFSTAYGYALHGKNGIQIAGKQHWPLDPTIYAVARRQVLRHPLILLTQRKSAEFTAVARGKDTLQGVPVEMVDVALDGATTTWYVDVNQGKILQTTYEARHGKNGTIVVRYSDFRNIDGLILPFSTTESFNGKELSSPIKKVDNYIVNGNISNERFTQP